MSTTDALDRLGAGVAGQNGERLEAVVAVEQARAVAQVAAAVQVAQQFPRSLDRVRQEVADAVADYDLAQVAFYSLPNRGQGMTVHVARELAVIWGNVDYGVHELRRDDERGVSEIQAFCWDMERNSKNTRTFQVPHAISITDRRTKVQSRKAIVDLDDVYRNNQSNGARAMRECVFATLPRWLFRLAERELRKTLQKGPGVPVDERVQLALGWAKRVRLTQAQLEARVGKPVREWTEEDVAALEVVAASIGRGETTVAEQFDEATGRVTVDELGDSAARPDEPRSAAARERAAQPEPSQVAEPVGDQQPATRQQVVKIIATLDDLGVEGDAAQHAWLTEELRRPVTTRNSLTRAEASTVIDVLGVMVAARDEESRNDAGIGTP